MHTVQLRSLPAGVPSAVCAICRYDLSTHALSQPVLDQMSHTRSWLMNRHTSTRLMRVQGTLRRGVSQHARATHGPASVSRVL
jgi:hypothetical protein